METRGAFLDTAGAFDAVPHFLLLKKIHAYGIRGNLFFTLEIISYGNNTYSAISMPDFINPGLHFRPFVVLKYDLAEGVENCLFYLYADDSSLFYIPVHFNDNAARQCRQCIFACPF
jgi:hypothetical protein